MRFVIIICLILSGCFSQKQAQKQFGKVAAVYPGIPADYCARVYPPKESLIIGKDSIRVDTLWGDVIIRDTLVERKVDTVRIYYTTQLPGKVITKTSVRVDTIYQENKARVDLLNIDLGKALTIATDKTKESDKWRRIAKIRFWIIAGLGAVLLTVLALVIKWKK